MADGHCSELMLCRSGSIPCQGQWAWGHAQQMPMSPTLVPILFVPTLWILGLPPQQLPWEPWCPLCGHSREWVDREPPRWAQRRHVESLVPITSTCLDVGVLLVCLPSADPVASQGSTSYWNSALVPSLYQWGEDTAHSKRIREKSSKRLGQPPGDSRLFMNGRNLHPHRCCVTMRVWTSWPRLPEPGKFLNKQLLKKSQFLLKSLFSSVQRDC